MSNEILANPGLIRVRPQFYLGAVLIGLAIASGAIFFWFGIESLFAAWQKPEYSHGFIIPVIAFLLLLKRLDWDRYYEAPQAGRWLGLGLVAVGVVLGLLGNLAAIPDIVTYGLLAVAGGFMLMATGWKGSLALWPAWVYLGFMLPLPNFIYWPLSIKLQFISSEIGVMLIKLMGIPVFLEGNIIDLGSYQLQVAEACSGLRYLFPLASFGFLFATLYRGPVWHKILIFLSAIPITVGMNSVRIAVIGVLVDRYGIEQAEGFLHFFEGWVIFGVCILLLFLLAVVLQRLSPNPQPVSAVLDVDTAGLAAKLAGFKRFPKSSALLGATLILCIAAAASVAAGKRDAVYPDRQRLTQFPMTIAEWNGMPSFLDFEIERVLGADDYLMASFSGEALAPPVNLLIAYYRAQNEGSGIHSPEVCIPAGGWEVSRWDQAQVDLAAKGGKNFAVNRAVIQKGRDRQLVYYWFEQRNRQITNDYVFKAYTVWESVKSGRSDGAMIRAVTHIEGNDLAAADQRLAAFLGDMLPHLADFVPP